MCFRLRKEGVPNERDRDSTIDRTAFFGFYAKRNLNGTFYWFLSSYTTRLDLD